MPEDIPQNIESAEAQTESLDQNPDTQLAASQDNLVKTSERIVDNASKLEINADALDLQRTNDLLTLANAMALRVEMKRVNEVTLKANIQKQIGDILNIEFGQELTGETNLESVTEPSAEIGKTSFGLKLKPGILLGAEGVPGSEKSKLFAAYTYTGDNFKVTVIGQHEEIPDGAELSARIKAKAKLTDEISAFGDVTVGGLNNPNAFSAEQLKAYLGLNFNIEKGQTVTVAIDPKEQSGSISFIGRF